MTLTELIFFLHLTRDYGIIVCVNDLWAISSAGRASALQAECRQFDPVIAHQKKTSCDLLHVVFFLAFFLFLCGHITSCIRDSRSFARRFAPSNDVRCGTSSILLSPTKRKHHVIRSVVLFLTFFLFLYGHITSCIRDSRSFAPRFAPSNDVRCGTSSILLSPTILKSSTCFAPWDFLLPFLLRSG